MTYFPIPSRCGTSSSSSSSSVLYLRRCTHYQSTITPVTTNTANKRNQEGGIRRRAYLILIDVLIFLIIMTITTVMTTTTTTKQIISSLKWKQQTQYPFSVLSSSIFKQSSSSSSWQEQHDPLVSSSSSLPKSYIQFVSAFTIPTTTTTSIRNTVFRQHTRQQHQQQQRSFVSSIVGSTKNPNDSSDSDSSSSSSSRYYDVIVVGGGHAGCEAAAAAARMGAKTVLVTQKINTIGELSCNPSIGGIGKGHLVKEIDALDGLQSVVADTAGIHYRLLNRRKGPAVRGPRAQMDRDIYQSTMQSILKQYENLSLYEASVQDLVLDEESNNNIIVPGQQSEKPSAQIRGVVVETIDPITKVSTNRHELYGKCVIITTGTFLRGVLMLGHDRYSGGRHLRDSDEVEPPSIGLAHTFARYQFPLGRLKTGTPARIDGTTIDYNKCMIQPTDNPVQPFSHLLQFHNEQPPCIARGDTINCYQTATNEKTHELVMKYEHLLPQYDGLDGKGNGPRYCPSIYKKVQRFPERTSHNTFLEPEGLNTNLVYPNGMSGPYPLEIQQLILRSMKGLEDVVIIRPGYDVEYDYINPQYTIQHTMETYQITGLYLAGQICGTTGYEEAAAQGIVAGANAGKMAIHLASTDSSSSSHNDRPKPFIIGRDEGYIGVLIDDLVTRGTTEPYRMFTSRSEYRISLRADNADFRLTQKGYDYGLVRNMERIDALQTRQYFLYDGIQKLNEFTLQVQDWAKWGDANTMGGDQLTKRIGQRKSAEDVLMMPHVTLQEVEDIIIKVQQHHDENQEEALMLKEKEERNSPGDVEAGMEDPPVPPKPKYTRTSPAVFDTLEATIKYQSYVKRQTRDMESYRKAQGLKLPPDLIYDLKELPTFNAEEIEKLRRIRPTSFAEAAQISGITPNSLVFLYHYINRKNKKKDTTRAAQYYNGPYSNTSTNTTTTTTTTTATTTE